MDAIYHSKEEKDNKLIFKDERTGDVYNLAYHYVVSEIMYLYVYKNASEKTVGHLNFLMEYESHDECWNDKAIRYIEDLAKENYSEDDYIFSDEKIENGDLGEERLEIVKSLDMYIVFDDEENIEKLDELLEDDSKVVEFDRLEVEEGKVTVVFNSASTLASYSAVNNNVVDVEFVSVWDDGIGIETKAKYNSKTGLVYDIETINEGIEGLNTLELEYIRLKDGTELSVSNEFSEYEIIDFAGLLKEAKSTTEPFCTDEKYPLFDEVLIDFANDNDVILNEFDIIVKSTIMDVDGDGYPYIEKNITIPKYKCELVICAYHHSKWDFYIEEFKLIED